MATSTFPTGVSGIDTGRDDPLIPRLVLGVLEEASLHPEGPFAVTPTTILALLRFELAQVLEDQNGGSMLLGKLHDASTHLVREILIGMPDLVPEGGVVLLPFDNQARLAALACNTSEQFLPKAGYLLTPTNEVGSQDRTFNGLDGAHRQMGIQIEIHRTNSRV
jgi:hypothetical protein